MIGFTELLNFFEKLDEENKKNLFTPGYTFTLINGDRRIQYVALDPRQRPPKNGLFMPWIRNDSDATCSEFKQKPMTNEDYLKSKTGRSLAIALATISGHEGNPDQDDVDYFEYWLKQEAKS